MPKQTHRIVAASSDWTVPSEDGVHRRTLVRGAAWTVPIVAVAVATPAAAASNTPTLAFTQPSYNGTACSTITGVQVRRTTDGTAPDVGKSITVTLADGYTFLGGATTFMDTTDANGLITLPPINVPAKGGNSTFAAASETLSAAAPVSAPVTGVAHQAAPGQDNVLVNVPPGTTALGDALFLASNGDLYYANALYASNVSNASFDFASDNTPRISYVAGGVAHQSTPTANEVQTNVPANSTAIGDALFLAPNGDLYFRNSLFASNVSSASFDFLSNDDYRISYVSGGVAHQAAPGQDNVLVNTPAGTTALGDALFLAPNGDLYYANTLYAYSVSSASFDFASDNTPRISYVAGGVAHQNAGGANEIQTNVPANSTAIGDALFLAPNGDLYFRNSLFASNVSSASFDFLSNDDYRISYVTSPSCS